MMQAGTPERACCIRAANRLGRILHASTRTFVEP